MKKILVISDSFKGSLSSGEIAEIAKLTLLPLDRFDVATSLFADGGEGSLECITSIGNTVSVETEVISLFGELQPATYLISGESAFIESASVCGVAGLCQHQKKPGMAASDGIGGLIKDAVSRGCTIINLFLGGTATVDGGAGMMRALGAVFTDADNNIINSGNPVLGFKSVDFSNLLMFNNFKINIISDVENSLLGEFGGVKVYGPQKGLPENEIVVYEKAMERWIEALNRQLPHNRALDGHERFSGAAGGMALPFLNSSACSVYSGFDWFSGFLNIEELIANSDVVITGEGRIDRQTAMGKGVGRLAGMCRSAAKPVYAVCGSTDGMTELFEDVFPLCNENTTLDEAMRDASILYAKRLLEIAKVL